MLIRSIDAHRLHHFANTDGGEYLPFMTAMTLPGQLAQTIHIVLGKALPTASLCSFMRLFRYQAKDCQNDSAL